MVGSVSHTRRSLNLAVGRFGDRCHPVAEIFSISAVVEMAGVLGR